MVNDGSSVWQKIVRAHKHIYDLQLICDDFANKVKPYRTVRESDPQTGQVSYRVVSVDSPPYHVGLIAGDAINNIRSALDHLAVWIIDNHTTVGPLKVYFPIHKSAPDYQSSEFRRIIQSTGKDLEKILDSVKPYKGGNDPLWLVKELSNIDKHNLLVGITSINTSRTETKSEWEKSRQDWPREHSGQLFPFSENARRFINPSGGPLTPLKAGDILLSVAESELNEEPQFTVEVALHEPGVIQCESIVPAIHRMKVAATKVVKDFGVPVPRGL